MLHIRGGQSGRPYTYGQYLADRVLSLNCRDEVNELAHIDRISLNQVLRAKSQTSCLAC